MKFHLLAALTSASVLRQTSGASFDWKTSKANGVNLGGWLVQESTIDTAWWTTNCGDAVDEWTCCANLGSRCASVLTRRYATWITPAEIDKLAAANITLLRIPTTYAAWTKVPGSQLYSGDQISYLKTIATYAITKYNMHIILDIHSLPGGVNGMPFGERQDAFGWFNNSTALDYSYRAVTAAVDFIKASGFASHFTFEPLNEPVDNRDITKFGTPLALSDEGAAWVVKYIKGVLTIVRNAKLDIPVMISDGFKGEAYFSPSFPATTNIVFDIHNYYFAGRGANSATAQDLICSDAKNSVGDGKFPVFIGEWSIQTEFNNKFDNRPKLLNTGLYAFNKYDHGSAYWTAKFSGAAVVDGEGTQADYWNYSAFIALGLIDPAEGSAWCK
jgi:aryl-phospho-beta-D-glucosidase BglC (GH1 family)